MTGPRVYYSHLYLTILCFIVNKWVENLKITKRKILCNHYVKKKKSLPPASLSENLLASCFIILLWWISSSIENLCELSTIIMPITMRFFFSVAAAALMERLPLAASYVMVTVTMVAHASWTQRQMYLCVCEYL